VLIPAERSRLYAISGAATSMMTIFAIERSRPAISQLDDRHPGLALDHGLAVYRASLRWTRHAIAALRAAPAPSSQPSSW